MRQQKLRLMLGLAEIYLNQLYTFLHWREVSQTSFQKSLYSTLHDNH